MIKKGDYLVIKPEWRDAGDEAFTWVARSDEQSGRVDISAVELAHLPLWPVQTVRIDMVKHRWAAQEGHKETRARLRNGGVRRPESRCPAPAKPFCATRRHLLRQAMRRVRQEVRS